MTESDGKKQMPVSIMVHHGLVDGYHLSRYINTLQALLDNNTCKYNKKSGIIPEKNRFFVSGSPFARRAHKSQV